ncbi:MAG: hypothetical protein NVV70_17170 [Cellulomonas sp.]|nr:hypothetical protein [Cellulomonas sp.]MCR6649779.1 hypothetical protein [Cellulomonas sp.]
MAVVIRLSDINFGSAASENEALSSPELLLDGFFDPANWAASAERGGACLILGTKGSGKSAIVEHLRLKHEDAADVFVSKSELDELSLDDFSKLQTGEAPGLTRSITAWKFLLMLRVFESLDSDESARLAIGPDFDAFKRELQQKGLFRQSAKQLAWRMSRATLKLDMRGVGAALDFERTSVHLVQVVELMTRVLKNAGGNRHIVALDGLDGVIPQTENEWQALTGLVEAAVRLNRELAGTGLKLLVLMRTDMYDRLPGTNTQKHKTDSALLIRWHDGTAADPGHFLFGMVNRKAAVSRPGLADVLEQYFPREIKFSSGRTLETWKFLLDYTRYTPRDVLQLLNAIGRRGTTDGRLRPLRVQNGAADYSLNYFVGEARNGINGFFEWSRVDEVFRALGQLKSQAFSFSEFTDALPGWSDDDLTRSMRHLYEVGAVGERVGPRGTRHTNFSFRNPNVVPRLDGNLLLQSALCRGLNVQWAGADGSASAANVRKRRRPRRA